MTAGIQDVLGAASWKKTSQRKDARIPISLEIAFKLLVLLGFMQEVDEGNKELLFILCKYTVQMHNWKMVSFMGMFPGSTWVSWVDLGLTPTGVP